MDSFGGGEPREVESTAVRARRGLLVVGSFVVLLYLIEILNTALFHSLNRTFGLRPRSLDGILDILTFPLLHSSLAHLMSNTLPLIIFGFLVFLSGHRVFITALAASPDGKRVYAGRTANDRVDIMVIDVVSERVGTIDVGYGPAACLDALRVDPSGKRLYAAVTDVGGSRLIVIDAETSRAQRVVAVGSPIRDIAYVGGTVYVLTSDRAVGGAVHVIDLATDKVTDRVELGGAPTQLVMSPDHSRAYIVDYDRVAVLCTLSLEVVDSLAIDARPSCVAPGADGTQLYVADYAGAVNVFSVESTVEMLYPQVLATDPIALSVPRSLQPVTV